MKAKTLGIIAAVGSYIIGLSAYESYVSGKPTSALIQGVLALIWAAISVTGFWMAHRETTAKKLSRTP